MREWKWSSGPLVTIDKLEKQPHKYLYNFKLMKTCSWLMRADRVHQLSIHLSRVKISYHIAKLPETYTCFYLVLTTWDFSYLFSILLNIDVFRSQRVTCLKTVAWFEQQTQNINEPSLL